MKIKRTNRYKIKHFTYSKTTTKPLAVVDQDKVFLQEIFFIFLLKTKYQCWLRRLKLFFIWPSGHHSELESTPRLKEANCPPNSLVNSFLVCLWLPHTVGTGSSTQ